VTVVTSLGSAACGCDAYAAPSIDLTIVDAKTGVPAAAGATVLVVGPAFTDSVTFGATEERHYIAWESEADEGAYAITVRKVGYEEWRRGAFVRNVGRCDHPKTVRLTAALIALGDAKQ
jgi:hypothetical protein